MDECLKRSALAVDESDMSNSRRLIRRSIVVAAATAVLGAGAAPAAQAGPKDPDDTTTTTTTTKSTKTTSTARKF